MTRLNPKHARENVAMLRLFAAFCIRHNASKIATAADWKKLGGVGFLKPHTEAIEKEIQRQIALKRQRNQARSYRLDYELPIKQRHTQVTEFLSRKRKTRPYSWQNGKSTGTFLLNDVVCVVEQHEHTDWDRYSKGWHRQYGPVRSYSTTITCYRREGMKIISKTYSIDSLNHLKGRLLEKVGEFLNMAKYHDKKGLRINEHVELVPLGEQKHTKLFERKFGRESLGYVGVRKGSHYHDDSIAGVIAGLRTKLAKARLSKRHEKYPINLSKPLGTTLRSYGFCAAGTADALAMLDLDDRKYELDELLQAGEWNRLPEVIRKYPKESSLIQRKMPTELLTTIKG